MSSQRVGVNIGSWLPWPIVPKIGLRLAAQMTRQVGGSFWQLLPLRGVTAKTIKKVDIPSLYLQRAWNPISFWDQLRGRMGADKMKATWIDVVFFPPPKKSEQRFNELLKVTGATHVYHHLQTGVGNFLVEIHPGLKKTPEELVVWAQQQRRGEPVFALDTRHLRRRCEEGASWNNWERALDLLLPFTVLIHVQPFDREELMKTLGGEATDLTRILTKIRAAGYPGKFVIEVPPDFLGPTYFLSIPGMIKVLSKLRQLIEETAL